MSGSVEEIKSHPITRYEFGDFEVFSFVENRCHSDGGLMFGVVPKMLWSQKIPVDENNMVPVDNNCLLIKHHRHHILIDCGLGDVISDKERKMYGCKTPTRIEECLDRIGLSPDMLTLVIPTHLHLDHVGGAFKQEGDEIVPRFPKARHAVRRMEWESAMNPDSRSAAAYPTQRLLALDNAGLIDQFEGDVELAPGVWSVRTGGHTAGHSAIIITDGERSVFFAADLIPTSIHLRPEYIAAADLFPLETLDHKKRFYDKIAGGDWVLAFDHDIEYKFARIKPDGREFHIEKVGEPFLAAVSSCRDNLKDKAE